MERPKVRFNQTTADSDQKQAMNTSSKGKIKVKSIVPINYPIKILKDGKRILTNNQPHINSFPESSMHKSLEIDKENINSDKNMINNIHSVHSSHYESGILSTASSSKISVDENFSENDYIDSGDNDNFILQDCVDKLNTMTIGDTVNNMQTIKDSGTKFTNNNKNTFLKHSNTEAVEKEIPCITCEDTDQDSDIEVIQVIKPSVKSQNHRKPRKYVNHNKQSLANSRTNYKNIITQNKSKTDQKGNKENYSKMTVLNKLENKFPASKSVKILKDATNDEVSKTVIIKKNPKIKKKIDLTPCSKFRKSSLTKSKSEVVQSKTIVTKSSVFDVVGSQSNISVEPTTLYKKGHKNTESNLNEVQEKKINISKDLLCQPEYNSTIYVIKNMKEIENEESVPNLEHLPSMYKNIIYGKVSAALDFAPYESVYTDLINLSVDDEKLPSRLVRSKDPEPRDKDMIPKLSDFFNPKYIEQHFTLISPPTLNPLNLNTLSSFTISNKIFSWKMSRDNFEYR